MLPQGVAFATIAGMPPEYGLYAAIVPAIVAALFGSIWHLVSGPTTAISIVIYSPHEHAGRARHAAYIELVLMVTFLTGVFQLAMGLARMGVLVNFISHTVVVGFTAGAALLIVAAQIQHFFGIPMERGMSFAETHRSSSSPHLDDINPYVTAVGAVTLLSAASLVRRAMAELPVHDRGDAGGQRVRRSRSMLIPGCRRHSASRRVGALPGGAAAARRCPICRSRRCARPLSIAIAITMLGLTEAVSIARAIALQVRAAHRRQPGIHRPGPVEHRRQLLLGLRVAAARSTAAASTTKPARRRRSPRCSRRSLLVLILLARGAARRATCRIAAMAGDPVPDRLGPDRLHHRSATSLRTSRRESGGARDHARRDAHSRELEFAIYIGVLLSLMLYLTRTSRPRIARREARPAPSTATSSPRDSGLPDCPQLKIVRINGSIFFGAVDHVQRVLAATSTRDNPAQKHLLIDAERHQLHRHRRRRDAGAGSEAPAQARRRALPLPRERRGARAARARRLPARTSARRISSRSRLAPIGFIYPKLDSEICRNLRVRIFRECQTSLPNGEPRADTDRSTARRGDTALGLIRMRRTAMTCMRAAPLSAFPRAGFRCRAARCAPT